MKAAGFSVSTEKRVFYEHIKTVFPAAVKERRKTSHETKTIYRGLKIKLPHLQPETKFSNLSELKQYLYKDFVISDENSQSITCSVGTGIKINDVPLCVTVKFLQNKSWVFKCE